MGPKGVLRLLAYLIVLVIVLWIAWEVIALLGLPFPLGRAIFLLIVIVLLLGVLDYVGVWTWRSKPPL